MDFNGAFLIVNMIFFVCLSFSHGFSCFDPKQNNWKSDGGFKAPGHVDHRIHGALAEDMVTKTNKCEVFFKLIVSI